MKEFKDLLKDLDSYTKKLQDRHKYVSQEFQDYGYRIATKLGEPKSRISLYIKLAKDKPRALLEQSYSFAIDYPNAKNRGRLFMWKLKQLEAERNAPAVADDSDEAEKPASNEKDIKKK